MPRLRPAPEPKENPKVLAEVIDNGSMGELGKEVVLTEDEIEPEIEVTDPEPQQDDAAKLLQKQLDDLRKSEQIQRDLATSAMRERDEALRRAQERDAQLVRAQKETQESQFDAISSALAAAKAEADKAQLDIENSISLGDAKGQSEAYRRLAVASANLARLEEGKEAIEARSKEQPQIQPQQLVDRVDAVIDSYQTTEANKNWLRQHRDYISDTEKNSVLNYTHFRLVREGISPTSPEYLAEMDKRMKAEFEPKERQQEPAQQQRTNIVSAPVSREIPTSDGNRSKGKVKLSAEQVEWAKNSGLTLEEYAKQVQKLHELKAAGQYTGGQ